MPLDNSAPSEELPEERTKLCELTPIQRVYVLRNVLNPCRSFLMEAKNFSTLGALATNGKVGSWDLDDLKLTNASPCLRLADVENIFSCDSIASETEYLGWSEGRQLFLMPHLRVLEYRWSYYVHVLPDVIDGQPHRFRIDEASHRVRLTSPSEDELGAILTGSMIRKIAQQLMALVHEQKVMHERIAMNLDAMNERMDTYISSIP